MAHIIHSSFHLAKRLTRVSLLLVLILFASWPVLLAITLVKPNVGVIYYQRQDIKLPTFYWHHTQNSPPAPILSLTAEAVLPFLFSLPFFFNLA